MYVNERLGNACLSGNNSFVLQFRRCAHIFHVCIVLSEVWAVEEVGSTNSSMLCVGLVSHIQWIVENICFFLCILCILCSLCFFVYFVFLVYSVVAALVLLASLERRCFLCILRIPCFYFVFSGQLQASSPGNLLSLERIVVGEKSR